jgi:hypothetical protein
MFDDKQLYYLLGLSLIVDPDSPARLVHGRRIEHVAGSSTIGVPLRDTMRVLRHLEDQLADELLTRARRSDSTELDRTGVMTLLDFSADHDFSDELEWARAIVRGSIGGTPADRRRTRRRPGLETALASTCVNFECHIA